MVRCKRVDIARLGITGFPGWLTQALLNDLAMSPICKVSEVSAFMHPSFSHLAGDLIKSYAIISSVHAVDLTKGLANHDALRAALKGVDVVLHSAAVIHPERTADWYRVNTEGSLQLARAARAADVRRFVFISSNAAAGRCESPTHVLTETDTAKPLSHYGRSKLLAEQGLMQLHEPGVFDVVILRPSMFYGPPVPERHLGIYRRLLFDRMPMIGDGQFRRSITYIGNMVQATCLALTSPAAAGEIFYVVDEPVYTTRSIIEAIASALGVSFKTLALPAAVGSAAYWIDRLLASTGIYWQNVHLLGESNWNIAISCDKIKAKLGYSPTISLNEGMRRAVDWCRSRGKL